MMSLLADEYQDTLFGYMTTSFHDALNVDSDHV